MFGLLLFLNYYLIYLEKKKLLAPKNHFDFMLNRHKLLKLTLVAGDIILIYCALFLTLALRHGDLSFWPEAKLQAFIMHFSWLAIIWILFLYMLGFYEIPPLKKVFVFFKNLLIFFFLAGAVGVAYFYLVPETEVAPKTILFLDVLIFSALFCCWRYFFSRFLKLSNFKEKVIMVGFRFGLEDLVKDRLFSESGYEITAFFSPDKSFSQKLLSFEGSAKYGLVSQISKLKEIAEKEKISGVIFPRFLQGNEKIIQQIFNNLSLNLNYISFADFYENIAKKIPLEAINEAWFLENISRSEKKVEDLLKRGFDIIFSFVGILVTVVLFPFIVLAIKLDSSGPVFYSQKRVGKSGRVFTLYKFRTMVAGAEQNGSQWTMPNDSRITRIGKVLRFFHIDEFAQFFNILKGDISFVGPRPESLELVETFEKEIPYYKIRYIIKPGFTGWAQLNFPASASVEQAKEKFGYDLYYIKNRNLFMDLGIILKTIRIILK